MTNLSRRFSFQLIIMVQSSSDTIFIWFSMCLSRATSLGSSSWQIQQVLDSFCSGCLSCSLSWQLCASCTDLTLCAFWCDFFECGFALRDVRALLLACETSLSWRLRLLRVGKPFPHFRHEKGFSPVWTNTCLSSVPFFLCCSHVCPFRPRCSSFSCRFVSFGSSAPVFERGFALRDVRTLLLVCETSLSWRLQLPRVGKVFPQYWHAKVFSPRVWTNMCLFKSSSKVKHLPHCLHLSLSSLPFFRSCSCVCPFRPRCSSFRCRFASFGCSTPVFERGFALRDVRTLLLVCETSLSWRLQLPRVGKFFHSTGTKKSSHLVCEPTCVCSSLQGRRTICHTVCIWVCPLCPSFDAVRVFALSDQDVLHSVADLLLSAVVPQFSNVVLP